MSKNESLDAMLAADGELTPAERAAFAAQTAARGADGAAIEASVVELGALVRGHLELSADEAEPRLADLWDLVERRLDRDAEAVTDDAAAPIAETPWFARVRGWFSGRRSHLVTGLVSAGAVAALALALRPSPTERVVVRTVPAPIPVQAALAPTAPEVESLDVAGGTGTVFTVTDEDGETAVIWVEAYDPADDAAEGI